MALLKPTPTGFEFAGRFQFVKEPNKDVWAHPVILDHKLYLRWQDTLFCYDIKGRRMINQLSNIARPPIRVSDFGLRISFGSRISEFGFSP